MVFATRCPHCETVFRVQGAELVRSRGLVRCGHCHELFDASQSLLDPSAAAAVGIDATTGEQEMPAPATPNDAAVTPPVQARDEPHESHEPPAPAQAEPREPPATPVEPVVPHEDSTAETPPSTFAGIIGNELHEQTVAATPAVHHEDSTTEPPPFTFAGIVSNELHEPTVAATPAVHHEDSTTEKPPSTFADIVDDELHEPTLPATPAVPHEDSTTEKPPSTFADIVDDELHEPTLPAAPAVPHEDSTTEKPPSTFADIVDDELHEPTLPATPAVPHEDSTTEKPPSTVADIVADEPSEPTLAATPDATPAKPALPLHEPATPPASTAPDRPVEHSASDTYAQPRAGWIDEPKHPHDDEPNLSHDDAPNLAWHRDPEPHFQMPSAAEPSIAPAGQAAHINVPQPGPADERIRPFEVTRERRVGARRHAWLLAVGSFVALAMLVLLIVQLAWWRREAVMVYWPASQSLFAGACAHLGCQISPPRDIDGLQVEASDLRQIDGPHQLELRVPLHNRYGIALAYPAIELTLFDGKNEVAIRRVLWPQDYAPPGAAIPRGLPPHATQTMIVRLDSGNAVATNFRVQIFYP